mgnify:FL=1
MTLQLTRQLQSDTLNKNLKTMVMRNFVVIRQKNLRKEWMMEWK